MHKKGLVDLPRGLEVLATLKGSEKCFYPFKGGREEFNPVLRVGRKKVSDLAIFPFDPPPLPVINDRSLNVSMSFNKSSIKRSCDNFRI